jgi:hypothetical protein
MNVLAADINNGFQCVYRIVELVKCPVKSYLHRISRFCQRSTSFLVNQSLGSQNTCYDSLTSQTFTSLCILLHDTKFFFAILKLPPQGRIMACTGMVIVSIIFLINPKEGVQPPSP